MSGFCSFSKHFQYNSSHRIKQTPVAVSRSIYFTGEEKAHDLTGIILRIILLTMIPSQLQIQFVKNFMRQGTYRLELNYVPLQK